MTDINDPEYILIETFDILTAEKAARMISEYVVPF